MPASAHNPTVISNCEVSIDGTTYGGAIDSAIAKPSYTTHKWDPVNGQSQTVVGPLSWSIELALGQDFKDASLLQVLIDRHGEQAEVILSPAGVGTGQPTITATVTLAAATEVGGKGGELATTGTTLGVKGKPVIVWGS
jgi:hypothetical protein